MPTKEDLRYFQSMPLDIKVAMTRTRIREWVTYYGESGTYISFSGGKDSTVLLHLVRELYPNVEAVFVNTGLEYPEIQSFAKSFDNVTILKPEMPFYEVIKTYGYPFISKSLSNLIYYRRKYKDKYDKYFNGEYKNTKGQKSLYDYSKYSQLSDCDFVLSDICCRVMKKKPFHDYERKTEKVPFVGTLADESISRTKSWIQTGCNAFDSKYQKSKPMSFWTENDVLKYIKENDIKISSIYGDIVPKQDQLQFDGIFEECKLRTTGCERTGCIFCGYGAHLDDYSRFLRLKETHPKQYNYCINGGEYDIDGLWKPNKQGLGMGHVIDVLNDLYSKNGKAFIDY